MSEIIPLDCILHFLPLELNSFVPQRTTIQRRFNSVLKPGLVSYFLCSDSICDLVLSRGHFFCHLLPHRVVSVYTNSEAVEATAALNSFHSSSTFAVHSESCRNKDDTLSAKVFLASFSPRAPT